MKSLLTTILTLLFVSGVYAQSNTYALMDKSTMTIEGTSTIHDWEADAEEFDVEIVFDTTAVNGKLGNNPIEKLLLTVPVKSIESGKGGMNRKMYGALKEDKHPNITFELSNAEVTQQPQGTNGNTPKYQMTATGMLTIAGVTKEVSFPVEASVEDTDTYQFTGSYEINMKDYEVDPPSAVFGTIKSGEMVTVFFDVYFSQN